MDNCYIDLQKRLNIFIRLLAARGDEGKGRVKIILARG